MKNLWTIDAALEVTKQTQKQATSKQGTLYSFSFTQIQAADDTFLSRENSTLAKSGICFIYAR